MSSLLKNAVRGAGGAATDNRRGYAHGAHSCHAALSLRGEQPLPAR
ncbi:hypothetical protein [Deinococcus sp. PESE-13]